jgi:hypothetical protein
VEPEQGYDFSVQVDLENLPAEQEEKDQLVSRISLLKRHAMAAPFEQAFDEYAVLHEQASHYTSESAPQGVREGGEVRAIHYRDPETIYIKASHDRVTVIFSTVFSDETDRVFGKVFLQEFADARRRAIQNAPQVLFRNDPPLELQGVPGLKSGKGEMSYITFGEEHLSRFVHEQNSDICSQSFSRVISPHSDDTRSFLTFRPSVIISTTTSRPVRLISTAVCAEGRQTSCRCCGVLVRKQRRRNEKRPVEEPSRFKDDECEIDAVSASR